MTTYTKRGNAIRAARAQLGKAAKAGFDFHIGGSDGAFTWTPARAKVAKKRVKGESKLAHQPQMKRLIGLCQRKSGATIKDMCATLSSAKEPLHEPTVRGAISRLNEEGEVTITTVRQGRIKIYHCDRPEAA